MNTTQLQKTLSVIVPVYNGEAYLGDCLESLVAQTLPQFEILVVDDGSTDRSAEIVAEYAARDSRIRLLTHASNRGLFQARITGVESSSGDYIAFVDSDDAVTCDWFRLLLQRATEKELDIVSGPFFCSYDDGRREYYNLDPLRAPQSLRREAVFDHFIGQEGACFSWHVVWNKLYARALWIDALPSLKVFSEAQGRLVMCEDVAFSVALWLRAESFETVTDGAYYDYRQHAEASTSQAGNRQKIEKNLCDIGASFGFAAREIEACGRGADLEKLLRWKLCYARLYYGYLCECRDAKPQDEQATVRELLVLSPDADLTREPPESGYFHSVCSQVDPKKLSDMELLKKKICSEEIDTVSFDLFDTLVLRPFLRPTDLFYLMQSEFESLCDIHSYLPYAELRVTAERTCRLRVRAAHRDWDEITLDEIYEQMGLDYGIEAAARERLKALEISLELRFCTPRRIGRELFELARLRGKRILVCSDMYLPQEIIEGILEKNGYAADAVYVSSKLRMSKATCRLYRHVQKELGIPGNKFLHIGDNPESDEKHARKSGWQSVCIPSPRSIFEGSCAYAGGGIYRTLLDSPGHIRDGQNAEQGYFGYRTVLAVAVNKLFDSPFSDLAKNSDYDAAPWRVGYFALGQYLYAVTDWLAAKAKHEGCRALHFVARDGYLPMLAYDLLRAQDSALPPADYLYLSRKTLAMADIGSPTDLFSFRHKFLIQNTNPEKLDRMFAPFYRDGVTSLRELDSMSDADYTACFQTEADYDAVLRRISELLDFAKIRAHKAELRQYFSEIVGENNLLFDIGYSGRGEAALTQLLGYRVDGAYVHGNTQSLAMREAQQGFTTDCFYDFKPRITGVVREHVFMKLAPSAIGYRRGEQGIEPIFEEDKINFSTRIFTEILQSAALDYVRDLTAIFGQELDKLYLRHSDLAWAFEAYLHRAKPLDRKMFACVIFEDEMGYGKAFSALDFWERDMTAQQLFADAVQTELTQDQKLRDTFMPYPKWKKALCYLILDRGHFRDSLKKALKK